MATDSVSGPNLPHTTQTLTTTVSPPPQNTTTGKGKSKIEEEEEEPTCGICLQEGGNGAISRGWIDSCNHYFCFVCIMEWSKLESKCPLCKRRFTTIRRPPKPGVFVSERVVNVPVRDQIYHYFGNSSVGPPNLYSDVKCAVCLNATDECLLLLCDLCDSASHTYCVGMGATVPEGDWFCSDCTLLKAEQTMDDLTVEDDNRSALAKFSKGSSTEEHVSIVDIVRDTHTAMVGRSLTNNVTSYTSSEEEAGMGDNTGDLGSRRQLTTLHSSSKLNTRTLSRCHNVRNRIQAFRENWNNLQSGSLSFSSTKFDHGAADGQKPEICGTTGKLDSESHSGPSDTSSNRSFNDISKAWKLMDIAKSIEGRKRTKSFHQNSIHPAKKTKSSKEVSSMNSRLTSSLNHQLRYQDLGCVDPGNHQQHHSLGNKNNRLKAQMQRNHNPSKDDVNNVSNGEQRTYSSENFVFSNSQGLYPPLRHGGSDGVGRKQPNRKLCKVPVINQNMICGSSCLNSSTPEAAVDAKIYCAKPVSSDSSFTSERNSLDRGLRGENGTNNKCKGYNDAKSEIRTLVKLNLKILTRDKTLEVHAFKQIASLATHSILAACGLEQRKPGVRPHPPSCICRHANEIGERRRSSLMPNSCRECFYVFVKDVVSAIMFEKRGFSETN